MKRWILLCLLFCYSLQQLPAHGDLHERIQQTTKEIKAQPDSAFLYFKRGKLLFQHEEYDKCLSDLKQARRLGHSSVFQQLLFAKTYHQLEDYPLALTHVDSILANDPVHVIAMKIKARIYFDQQQYLPAATTYECVIEHAYRTFPENYLDASMAWELLRTAEGKFRSVAIIEQGIQKLGPLISLYDALRDLHLRYRDYDRAQAVQQQIIQFSHRKEQAYFKASEIYVLQGRYPEAAAHLRLARQAIDQLPEHARHTESIVTLARQIEERSAKLSVHNQHR